MSGRCQQDEVYAAEIGVSQGRFFTSIDEIQQYVDSLRDTREWNAMGWWIVSRIEVGPVGRGRSGSVGWYEKDKSAGRIEMATCHWDQLTVLHEIAHVLAEAQHGSHAHDPCFARTYLVLVSSFMGASVYAELQAAFDRHGVNYDFPIVPESRFAL